MAESAAVNQKKAEVRDLARKYGVESYLGTEKLEMANAYVNMWANDSKGMDSLAANSMWLDAKADIEDVMANLSLQQNSKTDLFLLGSSVTGQVSMAEVASAYTDGWNTLMEQYAQGIGSMNDVQMGNLTRQRDRFLAMMPEYGDAQSKVEFSKMASNELSNIEAQLQQALANSKVNEGKIELAKRETTRTMILSEAKSGKKSGRIPVNVYQEIENLVGRKNSLFDGQVKSVHLFASDPTTLYSEMDRVLQKANLLLSTQENAFSLAGISKSHDPRYKNFRATMGATGNIGDGLRVVNVQNKLFNQYPHHIGQNISTMSNPPQVIPPNDAPPETTVLPTNFLNNPRQSYRFDALSQFDQYRLNQKEFQNKSKNNPAFQHKNAGLMGTSALGGTGLMESVSSSRMVQIASIMAGAWALTKIATTYATRDKTKKDYNRMDSFYSPSGL